MKLSTARVSVSGERFQTFVVEHAVEGAAAYAAGLRPGDTIESIDGTPAAKLKIPMW